VASLGTYANPAEEEQSHQKRKNKTRLLNRVHRQFLTGFGTKFKLIKSEYDSVFSPWRVTFGCV